MRKVFFQAAVLFFSPFAIQAQDVMGNRPFGDQDAKLGKPIYLRECAACHGEKGDGAGPAAPFLDIKPRNFTKKMFKLRTTETGKPPMTADILKTIDRGIPGTAMPSFSFLTSGEQKQATAYLLQLADMLDEPEPLAIPAPKKPPSKSDKTVALGKELYVKMQCGSCHGTTGKGDGTSAAALVDDEGKPVKVRDFTGGLFRGGNEPIDLYYRFTTGMDGSPMPSFAELMKEEERWALVDYVMSLKVTPPAVKYPSDPMAAGRMVTEKFNCRGCHVLDDGKGGDVGPDLRLSSQKLGSDWVRTFLKDPRAYGKIYPWRVARMPKLALSNEEVEVLVKYLSAMGNRTEPLAKKPDLKGVTPAELEIGKNMFVLRCTECHNLGNVIVIPEAKRQGPDLSRVAGRVDYDWAKTWISNPQKVDPKTKMTTPGITPEQIDAVRNFVWKTSMETPR